jgi:magnesium-transporting ATPase (P-type)
VSNAGAAVASIILGCTVGEGPKTGWIEGAAILAAVLIVSFVTAANDYAKDRQFRRLSAINNDKEVKVVRDGTKQLVRITELVVGDVVLVDTGDYIAADMILVEGNLVSVDESSLTGESESVHKLPLDHLQRQQQDHPEDTHPPNANLLSGCMVTEGSGKAIVVAVGEQSQYGKIRALMISEDEATPLQAKLEDLAELIGKIGLGAAVITLIVLVGKLVIVDILMKGKTWDWSTTQQVINSLITAITIRT